MTAFGERAAGRVPLRSNDLVVVTPEAGKVVNRGLLRLMNAKTPERGSDAFLEAVVGLLDGLPTEDRLSIAGSLRGTAALTLRNLGLPVSEMVGAPGCGEEPPDLNLAVVVAAIGRILGSPCICGKWLDIPVSKRHTYYGAWLLKHESARRQDEDAVVARWEKQGTPSALVERWPHWSVVGCARPGRQGLVVKVGTVDAAMSDLPVREAEEAMNASWKLNRSSGGSGLGVVVPLVARGPDGHFRLEADLGTVTGQDKRARKVLDHLKAALENVSGPQRLAAGDIVIIDKQLAFYSVEVPDELKSSESQEEKGNYWWTVATEVTARSAATAALTAGASGRLMDGRPARIRLQERRSLAA